MRVYEGFFVCVKYIIVKKGRMSQHCVLVWQSDIKVSCKSFIKHLSWLPRVNFFLEQKIEKWIGTRLWGTFDRSTRLSSSEIDRFLATHMLSQTKRVTSKYSNTSLLILTFLRDFCSSFDNKDYLKLISWIYIIIRNRYLVNYDLI